MSRFEAALQAAGDEPIRSLDLSMFGQYDLLNIILQRSEILPDVPDAGARIRAWIQGDDRPLLETVEDMGDDLARRALAFNCLEYLELKPLVDKLKPKRVADIGCGYAFFDFFLARDHGSELVLIDLEKNRLRHFNFRKRGAAYTSLDVARDFLAANGCKADRIETLNARSPALDEVTGVDLAISMISCGFHYPWETYRSFFENAVAPGGAILLDLRQRKAEPAIEVLSQIGTVETVARAALGKARRVLVKTPRKRIARAA